MTPHDLKSCDIKVILFFFDNIGPNLFLLILISFCHFQQPDVVRRDIKFAKSLQIAAKVKVPFPHSLSVVMKEK